jgi:hypothetical protein
MGCGKGRSLVLGSPVTLHPLSPPHLLPRTPPSPPSVVINEVERARRSRRKVRGRIGWD